MLLTGSFTLDAFPRGQKFAVEWRPTADLLIPMTICRGAAPGPLLVAVGGIHGDEYEGMRAIWQAFQTLDPDEMSGDFIGVPIAHVAAYDAISRESPLDGINLARSFPGSLQGSITNRLAHYLFQEIVAQANFLIDYHSGGIKYSFLPLIGFYQMPNEASQISFRLARHLNVRHLWEMPHTAGVLSYEACQRNIPVIGAEYYGEGKLRAEGAAVYADGIMRCLNFLEIIKGAKPKTCAQVLVQGDWELATTEGVFVSELKIGERVKSGQILGSIESISGQTLEVFKAGYDGVVMGLRAVARIKQGDWAVTVMRETALELFEPSEAFTVSTT